MTHIFKSLTKWWRKRVAWRRLTRALDRRSKDFFENPVVSYGVPLWDAETDYPEGSYCSQRDRIYKARRDTGPATHNACDPLKFGQAVWAPMSTDEPTRRTPAP